MQQRLFAFDSLAVVGIANLIVCYFVDVVIVAALVHVVVVG